MPPTIFVQGEEMNALGAPLFDEETPEDKIIGEELDELQRELDNGEEPSKDLLNDLEFRLAGEQDVPVTPTESEEEDATVEQGLEELEREINAGEEPNEDLLAFLDNELATPGEERQNLQKSPKKEIVEEWLEGELAKDIEEGEILSEEMLDSFEEAKLDALEGLDDLEDQEGQLNVGTAYSIKETLEEQIIDQEVDELERELDNGEKPKIELLNDLMQRLDGEGPAKPSKPMQPLNAQEQPKEQTLTSEENQLGTDVANYLNESLEGRADRLLAAKIQKELAVVDKDPQDVIGEQIRVLVEEGVQGIADPELSEQIISEVNRRMEVGSRV